MVAAGFVGLLELPIEDFRVVNTVATLQSSHAYHFVYVVETLIVDLRDLIFFNKDFRA